MIHKLLIVGLFLAVSLDVCLGRPKTEANKAIQDLADALIQGTVKPPNTIHFGDSNLVRCREVVYISEVIVEATPLNKRTEWVWLIANCTWTS